MATAKQRTAFNKVLKNIENGNPKSGSAVLMESGYSRAMAKNVKAVMESKGFQALLATIDDKKLIDRLYEFALDKKDKRIALESIKEVMKLKDRYPATKIKSLEYKKQVNKFVLPEDKAKPQEAQPEGYAE